MYPKWVGGESTCDCSPWSVGPNPGGRGGGRVRLTVGSQLVINGTVSADGESAGVYACMCASFLHLFTYGLMYTSLLLNGIVAVDGESVGMCAYVYVRAYICALDLHLHTCSYIHLPG
jgi:hypothetical protein